jgi:hypothetical protein
MAHRVVSTVYYVRPPQAALPAQMRADGVAPRAASGLPVFQRMARLGSDAPGGAYLAGVIAGYAVRAGTPDTPVKRPVYLLPRSVLPQLAEYRTVSRADGFFEFKGLPPGKPYVVIALDVNAQYDAVVHDRVTPEVP